MVSEQVHVVQGSSPIYNLLPDMLSSLSSEASLPGEQFQAIMRHLLSFIAKEKQVDSLVERLCLRFAATQVPLTHPLLALHPYPHTAASHTLACVFACYSLVSV